MRSSRTPRAEPVARLLLLGLGTLVGLLALEVGARAYAALSPRAAFAFRDWDPLLMQFALMGDCYRPVPGAQFHYSNGAVATVNRLGFRGPEVATPKPPGVFRVVLLGGSTSHGFGVDDGHAIDDHLRVRLAELRPGRRFEVVNLGFDGYDSGCDLERLRTSGLPLEPDAVIVHSGINDVAAARFSPPRRDISIPFRLPVIRLREQERRRQGPTLWDLTKHYLYAARVPGLLKHRPDPLPPPLPGPPLPPPGGTELFDSNLRRIAALAGEPTILLFSTPPSSLVFKAPPSPRMLVVDVATTQRYRDVLDQHIQRVAEEERERGRRSAYVRHVVPQERFADDCHLDSEGNRLVAVNLADALLRLIDAPVSPGLDRRRDP